MLKQTLLTSAAVFGLAATPALALDKAEVIVNYANLGEATYGDALKTAKELLAAVETLTTEPSAEALQAAKEAWLRARIPYQQSEAFRFGNPIVDDWEGKVNAWPLDEGLMDYTDENYIGPTDENEYASLNVVATPKFTIAGEEIDATTITPELIGEVLHEADGIDANVAAGYHAIEFLLWGQDTHGHEFGNGDRSWTDFAAGDDCTNGNCDRRGQYLLAATQLLVSDLDYMVDQWDADGAAREALVADPDAGVIAILTGMGSLSYGEQAGERMRLGVMLNDPEEEHDCFSDNTHNSHYYDGLGIKNVYLGHFISSEGVVTSGPSVSDLVAAIDPAVDAELRGKLDATMIALGAIKSAAEAGFSYDMMLEMGNEAGEALVMGGVNALVDQTRSIERAVAVLGIDPIALEGSDSLDNPSAVFQ